MRRISRRRLISRGPTSSRCCGNGDSRRQKSHWRFTTTKRPRRALAPSHLDVMQAFRCGNQRMGYPSRGSDNTLRSTPEPSDSLLQPSAIIPLLPEKQRILNGADALVGASADRVKLVFCELRLRTSQPQVYCQKRRVSFCFCTLA